MIQLGGLAPEQVRAAIGLPELDRLPVRPAPRWLQQAWGNRAAAMTLPWAIYVHPRLLAGDRQALARLLFHELVHARQWKELGVARFGWRYLTEYLRGRLSGLNHQQAYHAISFEEEARRLSGH